MINSQLLRSKILLTNLFLTSKTEPSAVRLRLQFRSAAFIAPSYFVATFFYVSGSFRSAALLSLAIELVTATLSNRFRSAASNAPSYFVATFSTSQHSTNSANSAQIYCLTQPSKLTLPTQQNSSVCCPRPVSSLSSQAIQQIRLRFAVNFTEQSAPPPHRLFH